MHVNGESAVGKSYSAVVNMVKRSREALQLIVVAQEDDILQSVSHVYSSRLRVESVTYKFVNRWRELPQKNLD